jgi:hypothetical protein
MMKKRLLLFAFLFAAYPVLSLAAYNVHEIAVRDMWRPLAVSLLLGGLVFWLMRLLARNWRSAALAALIVLVLFFSYGQVYSLVKGITLNGAALFRHRTLAPLWGIFGLLAVFWAARRVMLRETAISWLNLLTAVLLVSPIFTIATVTIQKSSAERSALRQVSQVAVSGGQSQPDVYYIILDAYGREDVLNGLLNYDNREFLDALRKRGFYVADCSQANYAYTEFSLTSSLNYGYLQDLGIRQHSTRVARLKHSDIRAFFEARGYKIAAFPTGWNNTEWEDADIYPQYEHGLLSLSDFERLVLDTTLLRISADMSRGGLQNAGRSELHRTRTLSALAVLKQLPNKREPLFVFAHLIIPHPPYSFGPQGEWGDLKGETFQDYREAYTGQVTFINREILQVVDTLLSKSETPPIIIIQGDHGPPPEIAKLYEDKMPILNAYYLPGVDVQEVLYPSISPVNTFRVVLNAYFGQSLLLLKDHSYYAPNENHETLEQVLNVCP